MYKQHIPSQPNNVLQELLHLTKGKCFHLENKDLQNIPIVQESMGLVHEKKELECVKKHSSKINIYEGFQSDNG